MGLSYHDLDLNRFEQESAIAVGVSGGPDSLALLWLLKEWAQAHDVALHALTVDHGLRAESADEAEAVKALMQDWPNAAHHTLLWQGDKPDTRLLEEARRARYGLMADHCHKHGIRYLFIAHHQDDQAETFLMRLSKGSGVDGLACMQVMQPLDHVTLVRPLLNIPKQDLIDLCTLHQLAFVQDRTNENTEYARPRLRAAKAALEEEGLTTKRLVTTAIRMGRARQALEFYTQGTFARSVRNQDPQSLSFDLVSLRQSPEEILVRVLQQAVAQVSPLDHDYPVRLEKIEALAQDIHRGKLTKTTTLGGCLFVPDAKNGLLWVKAEA